MGSREGRTAASAASVLERYSGKVRAARDMPLKRPRVFGYEVLGRDVRRPLMVLDRCGRGRIKSRFGRVKGDWGREMTRKRIARY